MMQQLPQINVLQYTNLLIYDVKSSPPVTSFSAKLFYSPDDLSFLFCYTFSIPHFSSHPFKIPHNHFAYVNPLNGGIPQHVIVGSVGSFCCFITLAHFLPF